MILNAVPFWWLIVMCNHSSYCDSGSFTRFVDIHTVGPLQYNRQALLSVRMMGLSSHCFFLLYIQYTYSRPIALLLSSFCTYGTISTVCSALLSVRTVGSSCLRSWRLCNSTRHVLVLLFKDAVTEANQSYKHY